MDFISIKINEFDKKYKHFYLNGILVIGENIEAIICYVWYLSLISNPATVRCMVRVLGLIFPFNNRKVSTQISN